MLTTSQKQLSTLGDSDSRKTSREARARPWLTGSVLRGQSVAAGVEVVKDAPLTSKTTTVSLVSSLAPTVTVRRVIEKQSGSKIPVLSRRCLSTLSDKGGVCEKGKSTAMPSTDTGMATFASRLPVRIKASPSGPRLAPPQQVRPSKDPDALVQVAIDKKVGKSVPTGGSSAPVRRSVRQARYRFEDMSIRKCINPKPIRTHRQAIPVKSILKHRVKPSEETSPHCPLASAGGRVTSTPRKSVTWAEVITVPTEPRPWPVAAVPAWKCRVCGGLGHKRWCSTLRDMTMAYRPEPQVWLEEQGSLGHDYLESSRGFLSAKGFDPLKPRYPEIFSQWFSEKYK